MKNFSIFIACFSTLLFLESSAYTEPFLEPFTYSENFGDRELNGWFSYPIYEDSAYDSGFRVNTIVNNDPNISIEQIVTPHFNVDTYCGAQKLLDMWLIPDSTIKLRYYLKTHLPPEYFKLRIASGIDSALEYTVNYPKTNQWVQLSVNYKDIVAQNPGIKGENAVKVNGIAVISKIPDADTKMNICLGVDDIEIKGAKISSFRFIEPEVKEFSEWKQCIIKKSYSKDDIFTLKGSWSADADKVTLEIATFSSQKNIIISEKLINNKGEWSLKPFKINLNNNFYLGKLKAYKNKEIIAETEFTFHVSPQNIGNQHPRLWFTNETKQVLINRLNTDKFKPLREKIARQAMESRTKYPPESFFYDWDQNVADGWTVPWNLWQFSGWNMQSGTDAFYINAIAYSLLGDKEAGIYAKNTLVKYSGFPTWNCPFYENRGQYSSLAFGFVSPKVALAYDLTYELMTPEEKNTVRDGIIRNMIIPTHRTYFENNMIPCSTSNWLAHIMGGDLMCIAAVYGDGGKELPEEYFAGAMIKMNDYIRNSFHEDGSYAEGHGYYNYAMIGTGESLPVIENLFGSDFSERIRGSYQELVWNSNIVNDWYFSFGCDQSRLHDYICQGNMAWLVEKTKDPVLSWFYNDIKQKSIKSGGDSVLIQELIHETENVPQKNPFDKSPSRIFPDQGRTVFKSGWNADDFAFSMTTGPYFNHEDIHMGSFWLADLGSRFIVDYWDGDKYGDPRYYGYKVQPIDHSTILIDHNELSQRSGDPYKCPDGFEDRAFIYEALDGEKAAFSSGDIGRLYWGKVKEMRRNVLFLKPRTILMLDTITPGDKDVDATLLFQTLFLKDIKAGNKESEITSGGNVLHINHLYPPEVESKAVERPHFLDALNRGEKYGSPFPATGPLEREGMLQVTARTSGKTLVVANVMKATPTGGEIKIRFAEGKGCVSGYADGIPFVFSTQPDSFYTYDNITTDALAFTQSGSSLFAVLTRNFINNGKIIICSDRPLTFEKNENSIKYFMPSDGAVEIGVDNNPSSVTVNGKDIKKPLYNPEKKTIRISLPGGDGVIKILY